MNDEPLVSAEEVASVLDTGENATPEGQNEDEGNAVQVFHGVTSRHPSVDFTHSLGAGQPPPRGIPPRP